MTAEDAGVPLHRPVLLNEVLRWLAPKDGQILADGTLGGGGHSQALAGAVGQSGRIIGLDRDPDAVRRARRLLQGLPVSTHWGNYRDLRTILAELEIPAVHGLLLDLGLSSDQLAAHERGFSFDAPGPLDMRFDTTEGETAADLVNRLPEQELADLIYRYGEERASRRIARAIVARRHERPIVTAADLAEIVRRAARRPRAREQIDPATRTFQALRIAVNDELEALSRVLQEAPACVVPGGRVVVISFHSLEDRIVKEAFRGAAYRALTPKPVTAGDNERAVNPRARSAKLRAAEVVAGS